MNNNHEVAEVNAYASFTTYGSLVGGEEGALKEFWDYQTYPRIMDAAIDLALDERKFSLGNVRLHVEGEDWRIDIDPSGFNIKGSEKDVPQNLLAQAKKVALAWKYL